jgi:hypothetical protein
MNEIYNQILDKLIIEFNKPNLKQKLHLYIINPIIKDIYQQIHNYFIIIISLYGITIILLLAILLIILIKYKKN